MPYWVSNDRQTPPTKVSLSYTASVRRTLACALSMQYSRLPSGCSDLNTTSCQASLSPSATASKPMPHHSFPKLMSLCNLKIRITTSLRNNPVVVINAHVVGIIDNKSCHSRSRRTNNPHLNTEHPKFLPFIRKPLIPESETRRTVSTPQRIVKPQAVPSVASAHAEVVRLAEHVVLVHPAVGKRLEADGLWRGRGFG